MLDVLKKCPKPKEDRELVIKSPKAAVFDISGGRRAFIEAEEAKELLSPFTQEGNSYTNIIFSNRSFGIEAARVAESILASIKGQLEAVDISDFVADRPEDEALEAMRIFSLAMEKVSMLKTRRLAFARQREMSMLMGIAMAALPECSAQGISNIAWALSKIGGELLYMSEMD